MKHPVKLATLRQMALFDPDAKGLIRYLHPQEAAYLEVMGREPPPPFPEGTVGHEQWTYRKGPRVSAVEVAAPDRKPAKGATKHRRGRKRVDA